MVGCVCILAGTGGAVIILMAGRKKRQSADIMQARALWADYLKKTGTTDTDENNRTADDGMDKTI